MNQDTNREDRVERTATDGKFAWDRRRASTQVCISCGSIGDLKRTLPCACGEQIDGGHDGSEI